MGRRLTEKWVSGPIDVGSRLRDGISYWIRATWNEGNGLFCTSLISMVLEVLCVHTDRQTLILNDKIQIHEESPEFHPMPAAKLKIAYYLSHPLLRLGFVRGLCVVCSDLIILLEETHSSCSSLFYLYTLSNTHDTSLTHHLTAQIQGPQNISKL